MQSTWDFGGMHPPAADELVTVHERVQAGPEFTELRRRLRGWVFPMTAAFLLWYLAFVLLASYARGAHGDAGVRRDHRGAAGRARPVRVDVRAHRGLRPLRAAPDRPASAGADPEPDRARRGPDRPAAR